jgi:hypothetical protein
MRAILRFFISTEFPSYIKNKNIVHVFNIFFLGGVTLLVHLFANKPSKVHVETVINSEIIEYILILVFIVSLLILVMKGLFRKIIPFLLFLIFTLIRRVLLLLILNILYFPIEILIISNTSNYFDSGFEISSLIITQITFLYVCINCIGYILREVKNN